MNNWSFWIFFSIREQRCEKERLWLWTPLEKGRDLWVSEKASMDYKSWLQATLDWQTLRALFTRKFEAHTHISSMWSGSPMSDISFQRRASHERKCCSNCFPHHKKKKTWKLANHNWAAVKSVLNQHWRERSTRKRRQKLPLPPPCLLITFYFPRQWHSSSGCLCKFTVPFRWNWCSKGPPKATPEVLI